MYYYCLEENVRKIQHSTEHRSEKAIYRTYVIRNVCVDLNGSKLLCTQYNDTKGDAILAIYDKILDLKRFLGAKDDDKSCKPSN